MLQRNLSNYDGSGPTWWQDLGHGAPTIAGFALLCSKAIGDGAFSADSENVDDQQKLGPLEGRLSIEAKAILSLAAGRGTFEIRAKQDGFDSVERFLAVAVETEVDVWRLLLDKAQARQTIRFLESFGQLCQHGLVIHHLQREFSLSSRGFDLADRLAAAGDVPKELLEFGELT
jgi:hypothetical protein